MKTIENLIKETAKFFLQDDFEEGGIVLSEEDIAKFEHFGNLYFQDRIVAFKDDIQQERDINESLQNQLRLALGHIKTLEAELEIRKQQAIYSTWGQKDNG